MHLGDKKQLKKNKLKIVVYTMTDIDGKKIDFQITSIVSCKAFSPWILTKIMDNPNELKKFENMKKLKRERFYLVEIKQTSYNDFTVVDVVDKTESKNEFYHLH